MKIAKAFLVLSFVLILAGSALAQGRGEKRGGPNGPGGFGPGGPGANFGDRIKELAKKLDLSDEQKAKVKDIVAEYEPKLKDAREKMENVLTPDQKKMRDEFRKKMMDSGRDGNRENMREAFEKMRDSMKLTDDQKTKQQEAGKAMMELSQEAMEKLKNVLTDEQKEKMKNMRPSRPFGGKRGDGKSRPGKDNAKEEKVKEST